MEAVRTRSPPLPPLDNPRRAACLACPFERHEQINVKAQFSLTDGLLAQANESWRPPTGGFLLEPHAGQRKPRKRTSHAIEEVCTHHSFNKPKK